MSFAIHATLSMFGRAKFSMRLAWLEQQPWWPTNDPPIHPQYGKWTQEGNETEACFVGSSPRQAINNVSKGARATLSSSATYWNKAFGSPQPSQNRFSLQRRKWHQSCMVRRRKKQSSWNSSTVEAIHVTVPNSTVLPPKVIELVAKRSGDQGSPLRSHRIQDFATALKR